MNRTGCASWRVCVGLTIAALIAGRNLEIADVILNWVTRNVPKAERRTAKTK